MGHIQGKQFTDILPLKSHFAHCAAFKVSNESKGGEGGLRVAEAAVEEIEVGGEQVGEDEQVRPGGRRS